MNKLREKRAITLIALVVTIIVLLILAGISINMLTGENGIFNKAQDARNNTDRSNLIEKAQVDIMEKQTANRGKITKEDLIEILKDEFPNIEEIPEETWQDQDLIKNIKLKSKSSNDIEITLSEIYSGEVSGIKVSDVEKNNNYSILGEDNNVKYYETLLSAVQDAKSGDTIIVLKDVTVNEQVPVDKNVTINLNEKTMDLKALIFTKDDTSGFTLTINGKGTMRTNLNLIQNQGNNNVSIEGINIKGIENEGKYYPLIINKGTGKIQIFNGSIENNSQCIWNYGNGTIEINGVTMVAEGDDACIYNGAGGEIIIKDESTISSKKITVNNASTGVVTIEGGNLSSEESYTIWNLNAGKIQIKGGNITPTKGAIATISNSGIGTITIEGGTISSSNSSYYAIYNYGDGEIQVKGNANIIGEGTAIMNMNDGTITVSGGTVTSKTAKAINNSKNGTVNVSGGTIEASTRTGYGICNSGGGNVYVSDGNIYNNEFIGIYNINGNIEITDGTISGLDNALNIYNGSSLVTGGKFTAKDGAGIYMTNGTLTLGSLDNPIDTTNLIVTGAYGVCNYNGTFNFYNGLIKGKTKVYTGTITAQRQNATLQSGTDGEYKTNYFEQNN